jgi:hypothetical protein
MPGGDHDVYILEDGSGGYLARPAVASVTHGNGITFRNLTPHPVVLEFPPAVLHPITLPPHVLHMLPDPLPPEIVQLLQTSTRTLAPNSKKNTFNFKGSVSGVFTYSGYVEVSPTSHPPIRGESQPKIIVDP